MAGVEMRRAVWDQTGRDLYVQFNRQMDAALGNAGGRLWYVGDDDGTQRNPMGGASLATGTYRWQVRSGGGNHLAVPLSGTAAKATPSTSNSVLLVQDAAVSVGSGKQLRVYATAGTNFGSLVSDANGGLTLGGTGASAGTLTLTALTGLASLALTTFLSIGTNPATTGGIRLANATQIIARNAANSADVSMMNLNAGNDAFFGDPTNAVGAYLRGSTSANMRVGSTNHVSVTATGTTVGASGDTLGFFATGGAARASALTQTYSTADRTLSAYTPNIQNAAYVGVNNAAAGFVYALVADLNTLRVAYENLRAFAEDLAQFVNSLVDDQQAYGLEQ